MIGKYVNTKISYIISHGEVLTIFVFEGEVEWSNMILMAICEETSKGLLP